MLIAVYSPNGSISHKVSSHRAAWSKMVLDSLGIERYVLQPEDSLANYSEVWLYLGMEWNGSLNLFGGASAENADKLIRLLDARKLKFLKTRPGPEGNVVPMLGTIAAARSHKTGAAPEWQAAPWEKLDKLCQGLEAVEQGFQPNVVVGDSHALSLYDGSSYICRYDHKTLHGMLAVDKIGLLEYTPDFKSPDRDHERWAQATYCFGNIDCQHHLARFGKDAALDLADKYIYQASLCFSKADKVEVMELLPVLPETRKIATPGYYKGKPWHGSWAERNELRTIFNARLEHAAKGISHVSIGRWPEYVYGAQGEFSPEYMEKPKGPHLSWEHRRQTWSL